MHIIFLGPPGAGKGTQAKNLSEKFNIPHLSTGEILRKISNEKNTVGIKIKKIIAEGNLVSDQLTIDVVKHRIDMEDCNKGFIFDGFPRNINQAENLDIIMNNKKKIINCVLHIDVPEEILIKRITGREVCENCSMTYNKYFNPFPKEGCSKCGSKKILIRSDDDLEAFKNVRLKKYREETLPLINFYMNKNILFTFQGTGNSGEISENIYKFLEKF